MSAAARSRVITQAHYSRTPLELYPHYRGCFTHFSGLVIHPLDYIPTKVDVSDDFPSIRVEWDSPTIPPPIVGAALHPRYPHYTASRACAQDCLSVDDMPLLAAPKRTWVKRTFSAPSREMQSVSCATRLTLPRLPITQGFASLLVCRRS